MKPLDLARDISVGILGRRCSGVPFPLNRRCEIWPMRPTQYFPICSCCGVGISLIGKDPKHGCFRSAVSSSGAVVVGGAASALFDVASLEWRCSVRLCVVLLIHCSIVPLLGIGLGFVVLCVSLLLF